MKNRVAVITGGTSGFGKGTAELLAAKGVKVVVSGRRKDLGEQVVADIRAKGGEAIFTITDVNESNWGQACDFAILNSLLDDSDLLLSSSPIAVLSESFLSYGSATPMRGKSSTCRQPQPLFLAVLDRRI